MTFTLASTQEAAIMWNICYAFNLDNNIVFIRTYKPCKQKLDMDGSLNRCKIESWIQQNQAKSHFIKHKMLPNYEVYVSNVIKL